MLTATQQHTARILRQGRKVAKLTALRAALKSGKVTRIYHKCDVTGIYYKPETHTT